MAGTIALFGMTGLVGSAVARRFLESGWQVRALVRDSNRIPPDLSQHVEVLSGDFGDVQSIERTIRGSQVVVNAAGRLSGGSLSDFEEANVTGPRAAVLAARSTGLFVHISSASVYAQPVRAVVGEYAGLEPFPARRGYYTLTKLEGERVVQREAARSSTPLAILRPGLVYGQGVDLPLGRLGRRVPGGIALVVGPRTAPLALSHADNLASLIELIAERRKTGLWNVSDDSSLTQADWFAAWRRSRPDGPRPVFLPAAIPLMLSGLAARLLRKKSLSYRVRRLLSPYRLDVSRLERELEWHAPIPVEETLRKSGRSRG